MTSSSLYLEISQSSLRALDGDQEIEIPLEREANGRLTSQGAEKLAHDLSEFLKKRNWQPRRRAFCAVGARGVSLRRLSLPPASQEELQRLLPLQIEREFPLVPDELAWGCIEPGPALAGNGAPTENAIVVAAVKKEVLQEYFNILSKCGLTPIFTLAALARNSLLTEPPGCYVLLDIGQSQSEVISFQNGAPQSIRLLAWGVEHLARAIEKDERSPEARATSPAGLQELAKMIPADWIGQKLYLTGGNDAVKNFGPQLAKAMGANTECERIDPASGEGASAAISGLRRACEKNGRPPLILQFQTIETAQNLGRPILWKWAALAVVFLIGSFSLRYAEMFLHQGRLSKKLSEIKGYREKLPDIERDLSFLQYLKTNQPAYLEPLFALANAAPPGTRLESLSMTRRGDLSLRAGMKDSQQVVDFRSKLLESGLFSTVVVEEQTPTPDRQRIVVRMTGQWKLKPL